MYKVNDYVMYGLTGACQITGIEKDECSSNGTEYYILHPVFNNNMTIKLPVRSENLIRPILNKDEVLGLIATMPTRDTLLFNDDRQRSNTLKAALKTGKNEELISIIKTLHLEKQAKAAANKTLSKSDEEIMNAAEKQLHEEFALALGITPDEVLPFILQQLDDQRK